MTTLPPEANDGQQGPDNGSGAAVPPPAGAPVPPPAAPPVPPVAPQVPPAAAPQAPPAAPQPGYAAPQQPGYAAPQQPGYAAPQAGGYQTPPPAGGGYQQPGYAQPVADPVSNITLNYWLSVFFSWIPALIFFLIEKDKGNPQARAYHAANLNFSLLRVMVIVATWILGVIPYLGWVLAPLLGIGSIVLFVFHIIAAVKAPENYRTGQQPGFLFNIPMVK
ncbi:hypothetical protein BMH25_01485 [Leucobacter sp. OLCALW19]|uniref:DUF4870 domain-containing protein n=5 Tax=Leucobacter TaxID=55968 RepID=UPI000C174C3A|nr:MULTISPECIES: DUF4870 domain-containing protein [unclassified Leucobacter]PII85852.1 hypothetical protein BMH25_01485 [Leucobacter sp. OLCALW19]PII96690.1 hypothetical protein BMH29_14740 [Leucobacter sp. OLDS2]